MTRRKEYAGHRFGRCVVISEAPHGVRRHDGARLRMWMIQCDCGTVVVRPTGEVPRTMSCGCVHTTHGMASTRQYKIWAKAKGRCMNPRDHAWSNYGGRGISMCREWAQSFDAFWRDMAEGYADNLEIDRRDNERGYEPGNCRWVLPIVNVLNRRNTRLIVVAGVAVPVVVAAAARGVPANTVWWRWNHGVRGDELFATPKYGNRLKKT